MTMTLEKALGILRANEAMLRARGVMHMGMRRFFGAEARRTAMWTCLVGTRSVGVWVSTNTLDFSSISAI